MIHLLSVISLMCTYSIYSITLPQSVRDNAQLSHQAQSVLLASFLDNLTTDNMVDSDPCNLHLLAPTALRSEVRRCKLFLAGTLFMILKPTQGL